MNRLALAALLVVVSRLGACDAKESSVKKSPPPPPTPRSKLATFGGGCFWCVEALFERVEGVESVESGYSGGDAPNPTYKQVCAGTTGHAEAVQVRYDSTKVTYETLLEIFWKTHDPTTPNRQGNDYGTQYRSVVFFHDADQKRIAEEVRASLTEAKAFGTATSLEVR